MNKRRSASAESPLAKIASSPGLVSSPPFSRPEFIAVGLILAVGIALRWLFLDRAAIEHFDEGVYASNIYFGPDGAWPMQHLYAPPLLPATIEILMVFLGIRDIIALLPVLLCGTATIALIWWIGRTWFTVPVGLAAALLAATSELHAVFSRIALTDVPLNFFLLAGIFAWERAVARQNWWYAIAAGLLTGLAGLTKYNGWLVIAIAVGAACIWLILSVRTRGDSQADNPSPPLGRLAATTLIAATIAAACWAPYLWQLQAEGGYSAVARNHARYVVGIAGWPDSATRQLANHLFLETAISCLGVGAAWILLRSFNQHRFGPLTGRAVGEGLLLAALAAWLGASLVLLIAGLGYAVRTLRHSPSLGRCAVLAGWWMLFVMTPLYHPYARLTLPWLAFAWLAAADAAGALASRIDRPLRAPAWVWLPVGIAAIVMTGWLSPRFIQTPTPWQPRTGMQQAAEEFAQAIREQQRLDQNHGREPTIFVFGEPAMVFQLRKLGLDVVRPVQAPAPLMKNPDLPTARVWLVIGPQGERDPSYARRWPEFEPFWRLRTEADIELSDVMLLDLVDPRNFSWSHPPRQTTMRLYAWKPEK